MVMTVVVAATVTKTNQGYRDIIARIIVHGRRADIDRRRLIVNRLLIHNCGRRLSH